MNAPRHGHTDEGSGAGVVIGCVALAALAFAASLAGVGYLIAFRSEAPPSAPPVLPPSSYPAPVSAADPTPAFDEAESFDEPDLLAAEAGDDWAEVEPSGIVAVIRGGPPDVRGSLDRDVVRRVIRGHFNEVQYCYEQGLFEDPNLSGRLTVSFVIGANGFVSSTRLAESTLGDSSASSAVVVCVVAAARRWPFPEPADGGIVLVNHPFILSSS